jgi:N-acetylmuramoyl-L-alanine amidase
VTIRERPSPNQGPRAPGPIDMLVLHYTGMTSAASALDRLCDPVAEVSAHYLIEEDGTVWRLVDETRRAWHAGRGFWAGERDINSRSIGIELANPGHEHGYRAFPEAQIEALETLARAVLSRHPIPPNRVLGHSDVAPQRKEDPGELFPWQRLAAAGIGLWSDFAGADAMGGAASVESAQQALARIGYEVTASGRLDAATRAVVIAFQRRYRPTCCNGELDPETMRRIAVVAAIAAP